MALKLEIKDIAGKPSGSIELPAAIFDVQANVPLIHQVVVERNHLSKRELVVLVRVQLDHLTNVMVELPMVQYLVSMTNAHQRK
jgi:hypothetical protein